MFGSGVWTGSPPRDPEHVLKDGVEPAELRFFLIHTHYRKKLNFTKERFEKSREKLRVFRDLAAKLIQSASPTGSSVCAQAIEGVEPAFQRHLGNDLSAGKGFDAVLEILQRCTKELKDDVMNTTDAQKLKDQLLRIDTVLGVIGEL